MINGWNAFINLGLVTHVLASIDKERGENDILNIVNLIATDLFFDSIEISEIKDRNIRDKVKEIIQIGHLVPVFGAGHTIFAEDLDLNSFDKHTRTIAINRFKELIDMAYFFEARTFAFASGPDVASNKHKDAKKILVDSLLAVCSYAKEQGEKNEQELGLVLESFDRYITHKLLIGPTKEAIEIVERVKNYNDNLGVMIDIGHLPLLGESISYALSIAGSYLKHVHIGNCVVGNKSDPRYGDTHPYFGYAAGENDVKQVSHFLSLLKDNGYFRLTRIEERKKLPTISIEIIRHPGENVTVLIANAKRVFARAWAIAI